jgi:glycosyltransferase involved in cell wall biosynthesis
MLRYPFEYSLFFIMAGFLITFLHIRRRYNAVQVNTMPDHLVFVPLIPKLLGASVILHVHEPMPELMLTIFGPHSIVYRILELLQMISVRFADRVLTVTEQMKQNLVSRGTDPDKITVILNVPDEKFFKGYPSQEFSPGTGEDFSLVAHGSMEFRYGLDLVIRAVHSLRDRIPGIRFHLLGKGSYQEKLKDLIQELKIGDRVTFHGYVRFEEMIEIIQNAHIGIVPMRQNPYSDLIHTNRMYEYIYFGKPIIISRTMAVDAYFRDSDLAFFQPNQFEDLARVILDLHENRSKLEMLATNAYHLYHTQYHWDKVKDIYLEVFESIIPGDPLS